MKNILKTLEEKDIVLNSISEGMIIVDMNRAVRSINNKACRILGREKVDTLERTIDEIFKVINMETGDYEENIIDRTLDTGEDFRDLIGATNPADAAQGTIRKKYATSIGENAVHGSDSNENAALEGSFHFAGREQF